MMPATQLKHGKYGLQAGLGAMSELAEFARKHLACCQ